MNRLATIVGLIALLVVLLVASDDPTCLGHPTLCLIAAQ
jgi:hypothetical protein